MKNKTHIYMANMLIEDLRANRINLPGLGSFTPPAEVRSAVINHPGAFRAGAVGPDFYPDLFLGQSIIHPEDSGRWIDVMFERLRLSPTSEREKNLAFFLGFMTHYAGDMFGHAYVNSYAKGWFPAYGDIVKSEENAKIVMRHALVEAYMDKRVPSSTSMQLSPPINFINDVFTSDKAYDIMREKGCLKEYSNPLGIFIDYRKDVHNDLLETAIGTVWGVTEYVQNWEEDVETGITTWLEEWAQAAAVFSGSNSSDQFNRVLDSLEKWFLLKFLSMYGCPDFVGQVISFLNDIDLFAPLKEILKQMAKEIVISLAKAVLGKIYTTIEDALNAIEDMLKNPKTWLDNGMVFPKAHVSVDLDDDFGNYGSESSSDGQTFHAVHQCLNMSKLCLIGSDNLNTIMQRVSGNMSFTGSTFSAAARLGYIAVKTKNVTGAGTDNNVYLGIRYNNGAKKYEVLCDKVRYNDFERNDQDIYPFFIPEHIKLSSVSAITARMSGHTAGGEWACDWIEMRDRSHNKLFKLDNDFKLNTGENKEFTGFNRLYNISTSPLRIDPQIINFLWSLDGKGKINNSNPATQEPWEIGFKFYTDQNLREKVFNPLFKKLDDGGPLPARVMTSFLPEVHGFHFDNSFKNEIITVGGETITTKGRCGGMAFAALDYFYNGVAIPAHTESCLPGKKLPVESILAKYIYARLMDSFIANGLKFILWTAKSDHDSSLLGKGVSQLTKTEEFPALIKALRKGPVALGLISATEISKIGDNHQVVAYGAEYDDTTGKMTVHLYDNNWPDKTITLTAHPNDLYFSTGSGTKYRGFFVESYSPKTPTYFDLVITRKLTAVFPGSGLPALGKALQANFTVKNFGEYPSALQGLYVRVSGPSGEELDKYLGSDGNQTRIEPGQERIYDKTCPKFGTTAGNYILQAGYCFYVEEKDDTHNVFNILYTPHPSTPPSVASGLSAELVIGIGNGSGSPQGNRYCINLRPNNPQGGITHLEMHKDTCEKLPDSSNRFWIGEYLSAEDAIQAVRENFDGAVDGCYFCCREVHTM